MNAASLFETKFGMADKRYLTVCKSKVKSLIKSPIAGNNIYSIDIEPIKTLIDADTSLSRCLAHNIVHHIPKHGQWTLPTD